MLSMQRKNPMMGQSPEHGVEEIPQELWVRERAESPPSGAGCAYPCSEWGQGDMLANTCNPGRVNLTET